MDWQGVVFFAAIAVVFVAVGSATSRWADRDMELLRRRFTTPQRGAATGTGVEQQPFPWATVAGELPRSPMAPVGGAADPRPVAPPTGLQHPVGPTGLPPVPTGPVRRQVVFHA